MVRYLSLEWIEALTAEVAASAELEALAAGHEIGVTQVVTAGPEGDVVYHLQVGDGAASFGPGAAWPEHVRMQLRPMNELLPAAERLNEEQLHRYERDLRCPRE